MALSTYGELKTAIADWLDRDDLTSVIPDFVTLAKSRIDTDVRVRRQEKRSVETTSSEFVTLPDDYIDMRSVQLNTNPARRLRPLTPAQADEQAWRENGEPVWYAIYGNVLQLWPKPDGSYDIEITYVATFEDFTQDSDSNWLLENHPDLYLYGSLLAAEPYVGNDERVQVWAAKYQEAVDRVNARANEGRFGPGMQMQTRRMQP
jgi:hypothetical protein